jgi:ABC-type nitrate/sulfonate/bicarbonate transport system permease component
MTVSERLIWFFGSLLVLALLVAAWQIVSSAGLVSRAFLPGPDRTWLAISKGLKSGAILVEAGETLLRMAYGWVLASLIGVVLGAFIGISPLARTYVAPMLELIRPLPASAIAPVAIVFLGMTDEMVLALVAFGSLWPMLLTTIHGFANIHPRLDEVSRALGLSRLGYIFKIALPSALPDILGGLRLGLTVALILTVVGEMLTVQGGLGSRILLAARAFRAPDIFAGVVVLGLIGLVNNAILSAVEARTLRWRPR